MNTQCRGNIQDSQPGGVTVAEVTTEQGGETLYHLLQRTSERPLADKSLLVEGLKILQSRDTLKIFVAYHDGIAVGAGVPLL